MSTDTRLDTSSSSAPADRGANLIAKIEALQAAQKEAQELKNRLTQMLSEIEELCKSGNKEAAYRMMQMELMPTMAESTGEQPMKETAASMNVVTAVGGYGTDLQADWQPDAKYTLAAANDFIKSVKDIYSKLKADVGRPDADKWLDPTVTSNLMKALEGIAQDLGYSSLSDPSFTGANLVSRVKAWAGNPAEGQKVFQNVDRRVSVFNDAVSSRNQTLGADLQFIQSSWAQLFATLQQIMKGGQEFQKVMVQAQVKG